MFKKIKLQIRQLAIDAVYRVESELSSQSGAEKKDTAINYILSDLPVLPFLKPVISSVLSNFIDDAVEFAVTFMKTKVQEKQEG